MNYQPLIWLIMAYGVLLLWYFSTSRKSVYSLLPLGLMVISTLTALLYWLFGQNYLYLWLGVVLLDLLSLLGVMGMEKSADKVSGASGWSTFGWLLIHLQLMFLLLAAKGAWWLWTYFTH